ncbi:Hypothetical protein ORPV_637 [Orpheovirus IHUMI-LCC2]|uniref:F-box domain-containing protein n=1 Tax=Orpheovirus IHUMI-LCC2 TaxID=2023057 RepID=A0A2I2L4U8_9VIRU|nr:Hypothetical protein ORPV_637 [Orpheovirus IHUMI-LCC2]SNW62541.1 Hypothetical protein ORPV_637 [Orpheovirus IHUMI-LCC2]
MDNTMNDLPNEILAIILGNGSYEDLIKYCYSSNKTLQSCNTNYVRNTIINKFLPPGLDYRRYSMEEILQLGKFNAMHCIDLYLYVNTSNVNDKNNRLASTLLGSEAYKKAIINIYILSFMKDDNYNIINPYNNNLEWLLGLDIENLIKLCGILYPIDSLLDIMDIYGNSQYTISHIFSRIFWTNRSKNDIVDIFEKYVKMVSKNHDTYMDTVFGNLETFIHYCIKFNREDIINYKIMDIFNKYLSKYDIKNDLTYIYKKFNGKKMKLSDVVEYLMNIKSNGGTYSEIYSGYIVHGGTITKEIKNTFSNTQVMEDWFDLTNFPSQLYNITNTYLPDEALDYSNIHNIINIGTRGRSLDYIKVISYVLGEAYDNNVFANALPDGNGAPNRLSFIAYSNNVAAIKSIFNKYYPTYFMRDVVNVSQFRKLLSLKEEIYKERGTNENGGLSDYNEYANRLRFYNKLYYRLLYKDIDNIIPMLPNSPTNI